VALYFATFVGSNFTPHQSAKPASAKRHRSIMSDFEDEMDLDVPSKDVTFSSNNAAKGKRSAANLPVEAEDSLPWCAPRC